MTFMVPLVNTMLILMGLLVFYFKDARAIYFELALAVFAWIFMSALLILSQQYSMLGRIYFPLFYWGILIGPLFLFSKSRLLCLIWAFLFFIGFFYWLADADISNSGFIFQYRTLIFFLLFPMIGLLYLLSEFLQFNRAMRQALKTCLFFSFLSIFFLLDFSALLSSIDGYVGAGGFTVMPFNLCLLTVAVVAGLIISLLGSPIKQKILLITYILFLLGSIYVPNNLLRLVLLQCVLISLLLFYASIHYRLATDTLAVIASMHLSLTLFKTTAPVELYYEHYFSIFIVFFVFIGCYFLALRKRIL